jgi:hypothetical protein
VAAVAELMERMLQGVFNEPDPEDVAFTDFEGTVTGRAALAAKVTGLLAQGRRRYGCRGGPRPPPFRALSA